MDLDDQKRLLELDPNDMYAEIVHIPDQLKTAWNADFSNIKNICSEKIKFALVSGMGGSAIGGDLLATYISSSCRIPVIINREYQLPVWAKGPETLVIASSHSGNTEETLENLDQAQKNQCQIIALSTGGNLAAQARSANFPLIQFDHMGQPRAAVGYSFGLLLKAFSLLGLIDNPEDELIKTIDDLQTTAQKLGRDVHIAHNPAKRMAGQLVGRYTAVLGADLLAPVARRWKTQINELAKAWAQFEFLPEADHNTAAGIEFPDGIANHMAAIFLVSNFNHPRNLIRAEITQKNLMVEGFFTDRYLAEGNNRLAHIWTTLQFGDFVAYYLSAAYGVDPTPIPGIQRIKSEMAKFPPNS